MKQKLLISLIVMMMVPVLGLAQAFVIEVEAGTGTLEAALADMEAGDIIELITDGGVYHSIETLQITLPTVIRAAEGLTAKPMLTSQAGGQQVRIMNSLTLSGVIFDGSATDSLETALYTPSLDSDPPSLDGYDLFVDNCDFQNYWNEVTTDEFGWAFYSSAGHADSVVITNCTFTHIMRENIRFSSVNASIQPGPANSFWIENNTFTGPSLYGASESIYLRAADAWLDPADPNFTADPLCYIGNNTFYQPQDKNIYLNNLSGAIVRNNIAVSADSGGYYLARIWPNTIFDYNMSFGGRLNESIVNLRETATFDTAMNYMGVDPMFADAADGDYHLIAGSPAIGAGLNGVNLGDQRWWPASSSLEERGTVVPRGFVLRDAYPNPFNPSTTISFDVPAQTHVELMVFNMLGQEVKSLVSESVSGGSYQVSWDGTDADGNQVPSGLYIYSLKTNTASQAKRMLLLK